MLLCCHAFSLPSIVSRPDLPAPEGARQCKRAHSGSNQRTTPLEDVCPVAERVVRSVGSEESVERPYPQRDGRLVARNGVVEGEDDPVVILASGEHLLRARRGTSLTFVVTTARRSAAMSRTSSASARCSSSGRSRLIATTTCPRSRSRLATRNEIISQRTILTQRAPLAGVPRAPVRVRPRGELAGATRPLRLCSQRSNGGPPRRGQPGRRDTPPCPRPSCRAGGSSDDGSHVKPGAKQSRPATGSPLAKVNQGMLVHP